MPKPRISGIDPAQGRPGALVTLSGQHLQDTTFVRFAGIDTGYTIDNQTTVRFAVPELGPTPADRSVLVVLSAPGGSADTTFLYLADDRPPDDPCKAIRIELALLQGQLAATVLELEASIAERERLSFIIARASEVLREAST